MAKSNDPGRFFPFFPSVGRTASGGRPLAFGLWRSCGKEKPPTSADFCEDADSGGEIAPSVWVTNPRARTFAPWCDWRTHNIHHVIMMSSEHECESRRSASRIGRHHGLDDGLSASVPGGFPGHLTAFRSLLLHNKYFALSSFARH